MFFFSNLLLMSVHLLSLNVQGFRSPDKQREVVHFPRQVGCDILFLQETNFRCARDVALFHERFSLACFFSYSMSRSCGVGVVIFRRDLLRDCYCRFDPDGRVITFNFYLGSAYFRVINVYAPADRSLTNRFFETLDAFFLDSSPFLLLGDFNCVLDSNRDVRGPGQGRPTSDAKELRRLVDGYELRDAWTESHGDLYEYTWSRGASSSRLDRAYYPAALTSWVSNIQVLDIPRVSGYVSDHRPLSVQLECPGHYPGRNTFWRFDASLLCDSAALRSLRSCLAETVAETTSSPEQWDALKVRWQTLSVAAGRQRKMAHSRALADVLRRIHVVQKGGAATLLMQDYLEILRARYARLMRMGSQAAATQTLRRAPVSDPEVLRYLRSASVTREAPTRIPVVNF